MADAIRLVAFFVVVFVRGHVVNIPAKLFSILAIDFGGEDVKVSNRGV